MFHRVRGSRFKIPRVAFVCRGVDPSAKELTSHQVFTVFILLETEKGERSEYKEYIKSLPPLSSFEGMPLLWSAKARRSLPPAAIRISLSRNSLKYRIFQPFFLSTVRRRSQSRRQLSQSSFLSNTLS